MRNGSCEAVKLPNYYGVESPPVSIDNQAVQLRTRLFYTRYALVGVFDDQIPRSFLTAFP
jgi:hypothetical protein